jgi:hypothetical protein
MLKDKDLHITATLEIAEDFRAPDGELTDSNTFIG